MSEQTSLAGGSSGRKAKDVLATSHEDADKIFQDLFDIGKLVKISAGRSEA